MAAQTKSPEIAAAFAPIADALVSGTDTIVAELSAGRGAAVDLGGYYNGDDSKIASVMRPSTTLNAIIG